jgi:hypothetical protein
MGELKIISRIPIETSAIHLLSMEELEPNLRGKVELKDVETREKKRLYVDKEEIGEYKRLLREHLAGWRELSMNNSINYVFLSPETDIEQAVMVLLREANILK